MPSEVEELRELVHQLQAEVARLRADNEALRQENAALKARVAELEGRAGGGEAPAWAKARNRKARRRKPGAQPGHPAHTRKADPPEETRDATAACCPRCAGPLGDPLETRDRVVEELVPARVKVTLWRVHRYRCPRCARRVEAPVPGVLPGQRFGLALMLLVAYLRTLGMSWGRLRAFLREAFGARVCHGALVRMQGTVAKALGPLYAGFLEEVKRAAAVHADDSGWRVDGDNHWLWILLCKHAAYFTVQPTRSRAVIEAHLGPDFEGTVVTDFYPSFKHLPYAQQKCLVHLLREIHRFEQRKAFEATPAWRAVRRRTRGLVTEARNGAERLRDDPEARGDLRARLEARARALGAETWDDPWAAKVAKLVGDYADRLFVFLTDDGVAWENNAAERGLRPMVVNRKISFGSRSPEGAHERCVLQSVAETARLRGTSFLDMARGHIPGAAGPPMPAT